MDGFGGLRDCVMVAYGRMNVWEVGCCIEIRGWWIWHLSGAVIISQAGTRQLFLALLYT